MRELVLAQRGPSSVSMALLNPSGERCKPLKVHPMVYGTEFTKDLSRF